MLALRRNNLDGFWNNDFLFDEMFGDGGPKPEDHRPIKPASFLTKTASRLARARCGPWSLFLFTLR